MVPGKVVPSNEERAQHLRRPAPELGAGDAGLDPSPHVLVDRDPRAPPQQQLQGLVRVSVPTERAHVRALENERLPTGSVTIISFGDHEHPCLAPVALRLESFQCSVKDAVTRALTLRRRKGFSALSGLVGRNHNASCRISRGLGQLEALRTQTGEGCVPHLRVHDRLLERERHLEDLTAWHRLVLSDRVGDALSRPNLLRLYRSTLLLQNVRVLLVHYARDLRHYWLEGGARALFEVGLPFVGLVGRGALPLADGPAPQTRECRRELGGVRRGQL